MDETTETNSRAAAQGLAHLAGKYLAFVLSQEKYGLQITKVQEIIGMMHITHVPRTANYLKGVINLRGKIIPVVDLRLKFGLPSIEPDDKTCILVVEVTLSGKSLAVGVIVDTVLEVLNFHVNQLEPAPEYGASLTTNFILGMGRSSTENVIILVDIEKALADTVAGMAADSAGTTQITEIKE